MGDETYGDDDDLLEHNKVQDDDVHDDNDDGTCLKSPLKLVFCHCQKGNSTVFESVHYFSERKYVRGCVISNLMLRKVPHLHR